VNGCRGISISEDEVCTSETVGKLIGIADHPEICLSDGNMVSLETNDQQFIVYNPALNIFNLTENQYASIFVSLEKVTLLETGREKIFMHIIYIFIYLNNCYFKKIIHHYVIKILFLIIIIFFIILFFFFKKYNIK